MGQGELDQTAQCAMPKMLPHLAQLPCLAECLRLPFSIALALLDMYVHRLHGLAGTQLGGTTHLELAFVQMPSGLTHSGMLPERWGSPFEVCSHAAQQALRQALLEQALLRGSICLT